MGRFADYYAAKTRQTRTPFNGGLQQYIQENSPLAQKSALFNPRLAAAMPAAVPQPPVRQERQKEVPKIDSENVIGSLSGILGPTPQEREAEEQRLQEHRRKMHGWTAAFNGLRHLANLYYATKGAPGQKLGDPHQQIEQQYQDERRRLADIHDRNQKYYANLYSLRRQVEADRRAKESHDAQMGWYDTRDEMARLKAENDRMKAEQQVATQKARQAQIESKTSQMNELHPLQQQKLRAVIQKTMHDAGRPYGRSGSGSGRSSGYDPFTELAVQLNESPETIGPILQQEGLGYYDEDTKEFTFAKNATKGMATTAVKRARGQGRGSSSGGRNSYKHTKKLGL